MLRTFCNGGHILHFCFCDTIGIIYNIFTKLLFLTIQIFATAALEFQQNVHYPYAYVYVYMCMCVCVCVCVFVCACVPHLQRVIRKVLITALLPALSNYLLVCSGLTES